MRLPKTPDAENCPMNQVKDTARATVRLGYDGLVHKTFRGPQAEERFVNEVRVLQYLEQRDCPFVPRLLSSDPDKLLMVTTNCGSRVERMDETRVAALFAELEAFGVRHEDRFLRNITYCAKLGRFCLIDFEFATILDDPSDGDGAGKSTAPPVDPMAKRSGDAAGLPDAPEKADHPITDHR